MRRGLVLGLLCLVANAWVAQAQEDNATAAPSSAAAGNCLCEGRGDLRSDLVLDMLGDLISSLPEELQQPTPSCGDIQDYYANETECPEVLWMSFCCTDEPPQDQCANQVRNEILSGYDKISVPSTSLVHDPVNVSVEMIYHTITDIDEAEGLMEVFVTLNLKWTDQRLSWEYDPSPNGTCTGLPINVRAQMQQGLKDSEIWVPEFDLFNQISGVTGMAGPLAIVGRNGDVKWTRMGQLKAICQMENLGQIPYETLGCQLLMGSRSLGVNYQLNPSGGIKVSSYAGPYNGYRLVSAEPGVSEFANGVDAIFFNLEYTRGTSYYTQNVIIPVILFSYCSILTMVVGVGAFQTLALNFTLLLVTVTQKISIANLLPITNEALWIVDFVFGSFYFIVVTIAETFFKFIILKMREERQTAETAASPIEEGPDEGDGDPRSKKKSLSLPPWFFTFSTRRMDVFCCLISFSIYTLYVIFFFALQKNWGGSVNIFHLENITTSGEL